MSTAPRAAPDPIDAYLWRLRTERGCSPRTLDGYGRELAVLARLADGTALHLRLQNSARATPPGAGSPIGIVIEEGAARLLAD
jgi:site-specific recombinase XerC